MCIRDRQRGAEIFAELAGYANTSDGYHVTSPDPEGTGAINCMRLALSMAEMKPEDIGYINAHGTSTPLGDPIETRAIKAVFGQNPPPVSSTKGATGHLMGAGGITETIACIPVSYTHLDVYKRQLCTLNSGYRFLYDCAGLFIIT